MSQQKRRRRIIGKRDAKFSLEIRRSKIHGRGVFALEDIPAKQFVIEYKGEKISHAEARRRYGRPKGPQGWKPTYLFKLNSRTAIDGAVRGSGAELINHCCDPSLRTQVRRGHIYCISDRNIQPGEELTIDYKFSKDLPKVPCHCGSPKCRGTINRRGK